MNISINRKHTFPEMKPALPRTFLFLITLLLLVSRVPVFGQNNIDSLVKKFKFYRSNTLQEKIFVHTDRSFYLTGETIWFKLYYVDGTLNQPLDLSKVAYVEILDKDKKALVQTKVGLEAGSGNGSLFLPASLPSGNYLIRAYTHWMRNFSPDFYFQEFVTVVNPFTRLGLKPTPETPQYDVQFFPEGGILVNGLNCKIAFRASDAQGKGIDCRGAILNDKNDTVARFRPLKFGIGNFSFTPEIEQAYKAIIRDKKNHVFTYPLPVVHDAGYTVRVTDTLTDQVKIAVQAQAVFSSPDNQFVYFLIHNREVIKVAEKHYLQSTASKVIKVAKTNYEFVTSTLLQKAQAQILIDKKVLGEGISHITVFNSDMLPVCERLYFRSPETKLQIDGKLEQPQFAARKKVSLSLLTHTPDEKPTSANLSVAVYKIDSLQSIEPAGISSYLWLTSDLKGTIESPQYYFNSSGDTLKQATDNLMLTHGWSRFRWEDVLKPWKNSFDFIPEYRGHIITGRVINESGGPGNGVVTYLSSPGKNVRLYPSKANENGMVQFELKDFFGTRKIIVQTNILVDSTSTIKLLNPFSESPFSLRVPEFHFPEKLRNQAVQRSLHMQVQNTFNEEKNIRYTLPPIDSSAFYGRADEHYQLDDYTRFPTMEEVLREYVPGVVVRKKNGKFRFLTLDVPGKNLFRGNPLVLLDGVPVFNIDKIMAFDPRNVKQLDVLTRRYFLGHLSFQGISSFTTYHGDMTDFEPDYRSLVLNYEGLQLHREFFSPRYETDEQRESRLPDSRSLLYWCPTLKTDAQGKQQCDFYTPDVDGKYKIVIQGITKEGAPGSTEFVFEVKSSRNY